MHEALLAAYQATDYRVRLARGGWAVIRIGQMLPPELLALAQTRPWGFITAWNPRSEAAPRTANRLAQKTLLSHLRALPETLSIRPGIGVAADGRWREPSWWVIGPSIPALDALARRFGQFGYLHGQAGAAAQLHLLPPDISEPPFGA